MVIKVKGAKGSKGKSSGSVKEHAYRILIKNDTLPQTQTVSTHHTLAHTTHFGPINVEI